MNRRVIITGLGFVTNEGCSSESIWNMVCKGKKKKYVSDIKDFELTNDLRDRYVGICTCARIGIKAAELAWNEALAEDSDISRDRWGIMAGTAFGESASMYANQCRTLVEQGTSWLLPSMAMNKGAKTTADIYSIEHKLYGGNLTFESGKIASGMAALHAYDEITHDFLDGVVVVGVEYIDDCLVSALKSVGFPGYEYLSSGACAIVMEAEGRSGSNGASAIVAAVESLANAGKPYSYNRSLYKSIKNCIVKTINSAGMALNDIDLIIYSKVNNPIADFCCEKALTKLFGVEGNKAVIVSATDILGDMLGANPSMAIGLGLIFLNKQCVINSYLVKPKVVKNVVVAAYDISGAVWAMVLSGCF